MNYIKVVAIISVAMLPSLNIANGQQNILNKIHVCFNHPVDTSRNKGVPAQYSTVFIADTMAVYVNKAKYSIDVAQYDYTAYSSSGVGAFATAINNAYSRGVKIRWICDGNAPNSGLKLLNSSIPVLPSPTSSSYTIMHNKFIVIDVDSPDTTDAIILTGSADWSSYMDNGDYNNHVIIQSKQLALAYTQEFNIMWGDSIFGGAPNKTISKFGQYKTAVKNNVFTIGGSKVELYFSPTDSVNRHILNSINSANTDLYFGMYAFSEDNDATAIANCAKAGVYAAGVVDQYSVGYNAYTILSNQLGPNVAIYTGSEIYHDKYLVVDPNDSCSDPLVLTGSHNWTNSANISNDENTLIIHNDTIANLYYQSIAEDYYVISGSVLKKGISGCVLGIPHITATSSINIYPTPAKDYFTVYTKGYIPALISVFNLTGELISISHPNTQRTIISTIAFPTGIYFIKIQTEEGNTEISKVEIIK